MPANLTAPAVLPLLTAAVVGKSLRLPASRDVSDREVVCPKGGETPQAVNVLTALDRLSYLVQVQQ